MRTISSLWNDQEGQTTTEYMLIIGAVVAAILAAAYAFIDPFKAGVTALGNNIKSTLSKGFGS